jgi:hypothetical protein
MKDLAYGPDLAPRDFFPFRYTKEQLKGRSFAQEEELLSGLAGLMSEIPPDVILRVFADWNQSLRLCLLTEDEYAEPSSSFHGFESQLPKLTKMNPATGGNDGQPSGRIL